MKKTIYELHYIYYQYNSGAADNGEYKKIKSFEKYEQAFEIYKSIQLSIQKAKLIKEKQAKNDYTNLIKFPLSDDNDDQLKDKLIPYMGFFLEAFLLKVIKQEVILDENGKEKSPENIFPHLHFNDCEYCYDESEGESIGCSHCDDGIRKLTPENMELARSAKEWAEEQMQSLWTEYNEVYQLKRGLVNWSIHGKSITIEAGYSYRGQSNSDDYELPLHWLYAANRKELIQNEYDLKQGKQQEEKIEEDRKKLAWLKQEAEELEKKLK